MINKSYNVCEIFLSKEEIDVAIKEYIQNHNNQIISNPKSITYSYNLQGNKLRGTNVVLVFKNPEEIQKETVTESSEEEQSLQEEQGIDQDSDASNSKKKKGSRGPLFSRGGLLAEKVRLKF